MCGAATNNVFSTIAYTTSYIYLVSQRHRAQAANDASRVDMAKRRLDDISAETTTTTIMRRTMLAAEAERQRAKRTTQTSSRLDVQNVHHTHSNIQHPNPTARRDRRNERNVFNGNGVPPDLVRGMPSAALELGRFASHKMESSTVRALPCHHHHASHTIYIYGFVKSECICCPTLTRCWSTCVCLHDERSLWGELTIELCVYVHARPTFEFSRNRWVPTTTKPA